MQVAEEMIDGLEVVVLGKKVECGIIVVRQYFVQSNSNT
jgi:hypothetical protein